MICGSTPDIPIRGHYFPFGKFLNKPGHKNILIVGDAAGLVEPITGEGVSFAMQSGKFAAEAILSAHSAGKPEMAYKIYKQKYAYFKKNFYNDYYIFILRNLWIEVFKSFLKNPLSEIKE
jgi:flavin-dependent dehydrogenase